MEFAHIALVLRGNASVLLTHQTLLAIAGVVALLSQWEVRVGALFPLAPFLLLLLVDPYIALVLGGEAGIFFTLKTLHTVTDDLALLAQLGLGRLLRYFISLRSGCMWLS